ncbi:hypothetical protein B5F77_14765 [Parabacteroides sp. An277]|nr:hypothetical protein B5F77_14765 [Parabacteroides sp. An277]
MLSGCIMYSHSYILLPQGIKVEVVLYNIGVGLSRCSFRLDGRCQSLLAWNERQSTVPTLFYCLIFSGGEQGEEESVKMEIDLTLNYPKRIYKFYSLTDYNVEAFLNHYFFLSHPFHLNDLMDGESYTIDMRHVESDVYHRLRKQILEYVPVFVEQKMYDHLDPYTDKKRIWLQSAIMASFFSYGGIVSLANDNRFSELMWSHYTQETGFMLEFDVETLLRSVAFHPHNNVRFKKCYFQKVQYKNHPLSISCLRYPNIEIINLFNATQKNKEWQYEKEWRLIMTSYRYLGLPKSIYTDDPVVTDVSERKLFYSSDAIKRIYLGKKFWTIQNIKKEIKIGDNVREYIVNDEVILFIHELCKYKDKVYMSGACDCAAYKLGTSHPIYNCITQKSEFEPEYYYLTRSFEKIRNISVDKNIVSVVYDGIPRTQNEDFDDVISDCNRINFKIR